MRFNRIQTVLIVFLFFYAVGPVRGDKKLFSSPIDFKNLPHHFIRTVEALRAVSYVKADFQEERKLPYLKQSIESKGSITYASQIGLRREITQPVRQLWMITTQEASLILEDENESIKTLVQSDEFQSIAKNFLVIFSGDLEEWNKQFYIFYLGKPSNWILGFKPQKKNLLAHFVRTIELSGVGAEVHQMRWEGKDGDIAETRFHNIDLRQALSISEIQSLFEIQSKTP